MKYSALLSLALVGSAEAFRTQATKKQPRKLEECNNAPDIFTDDYTTFGATYKVNSYRGNPNCQDLGFAYGYKMDERCFDATDHPFGTEDSSIKYAKTQGDCASGTTPSGTFTTKCIDDGETPETAAPTVECEYDWVVDHDVATSPAEVGIHVEMFPYAEKAHFNITLDDPQYGGKTFTDGWCIDWDRLIGTQDWDVDIFSFASMPSPPLLWTSTTCSPTWHG
ncbi:expressed unknown protein [Seminavis robusta]|uniref:Uncharacterized protein n=1 Tax=Seminavis robusta TaxID=568900 RepID=A0A9N8DCE8_9STRA|nr:expressed unknown protein [Seminavis robusta]|eukprot:Sro88_g046470.1 n/a (223) ;mRNA; f:55042-55890